MLTSRLVSRAGESVFPTSRASLLARRDRELRAGLVGEQPTRSPCIRRHRTAASRPCKPARTAEFASKKSKAPSARDRPAGGASAPSSPATSVDCVGENLLARQLFDRRTVTERSDSLPGGLTLDVISKSLSGG